MKFNIKLSALFLLLVLCFEMSRADSNWRNKYTKVEQFEDGIARVELNGKYGYVDINGKVIIPVI